jgi:hypothetical protein
VRSCLGTGARFSTNTGPSIQRHQDAGQPHRSRGEIRDRYSGHRGLAIVAEIDADDACKSFAGEVVCRHVAIWARLAERRDRAIDDPRTSFAHRVVVEAEAGRDARTECLDEYVRALGDAHQRLAGRGRLQVQHDAALAAIEVAEEHALAALAEPDVTPRIAIARRLDLDHLGAVIGHHLREVRARQEQREVEDPHALELHQAAPRSRSAAISVSE